MHGEDADQRLVLDHPALRVFVASAPYLLAMKLLAARVERDADDIALLLRLSGITRVEDALDLVEGAYGKGRISVKTSLLVETLLASG